MKTSRFSESQILAILRQAEGKSLCLSYAGRVRDEHSVFYKWRSKYGGYVECYSRAARNEWLDQYIIESRQETKEFDTQWLWRTTTKGSIWVSAA